MCEGVKGKQLQCVSTQSGHRRCLLLTKSFVCEFILEAVAHKSSTLLNNKDHLRDFYFNKSTIFKIEGEMLCFNKNRSNLMKQEHLRHISSIDGKEQLSFSGRWITTFRKKIKHAHKNNLINTTSMR